MGGFKFAMLKVNEILNKITKATRLCLESPICLLLMFDALYERFYHYKLTVN